MISRFTRLGALSAAFGVALVALPFVASTCAVAQPGGDGASGGVACLTKANCPGDLVCKGGHCSPCSCPKGDACDFDTGVCISGAEGCVPDCLEGTFCSVAGECIPDGTCNSEIDCDFGFLCDTSLHECLPAGGCEGEIASKRLSPNLMIVFDRTGSMVKAVPGTMDNRLDVARKVVSAVVTANESSVRFGLSLMSACKEGGCAPGIVNDPIGSEAVTLQQTLAGTTACESGNSESSLAATLQTFVNYAPLQDEGRDNAIVVIIDGGENCGGDPVQQASALAGQPIPIPLHVIGFSSEVDTAQMTAIADAAGTSPYAQTETEADLAAALEGVVSSLQSCAFELAQAPSGDDVHVFFNNEAVEVPRDGINGWTLDPVWNAVVFHGMACDFVLGGNVEDLDVVEGCTAPTPD